MRSGSTHSVWHSLWGTTHSVWHSLHATLSLSHSRITLETYATLRLTAKPLPAQVTCHAPPAALPPLRFGRYLLIIRSSGDKRQFVYRCTRLSITIASDFGICNIDSHSFMYCAPIYNVFELMLWPSHTHTHTHLKLPRHCFNWAHRDNQLAKLLAQL